MNRVADTIAVSSGADYYPGHVRKILPATARSCRKPERRAPERDEGAFRRWRQEASSSTEGTRLRRWSIVS